MIKYAESMHDHMNPASFPNPIQTIYGGQNRPESQHPHRKQLATESSFVDGYTEQQQQTCLIQFQNHTAGTNRSKLSWVLISFVVLTAGVSFEGKEGELPEYYK